MAGERAGGWSERVDAGPESNRAWLGARLESGAWVCVAGERAGGWSVGVWVWPGSERVCVAGERAGGRREEEERGSRGEEQQGRAVERQERSRGEGAGARVCALNKILPLLVLPVRSSV